MPSLPPAERSKLALTVLETMLTDEISLAEACERYGTNRHTWRHDILIQMGNLKQLNEMVQTSMYESVITAAQFLANTTLRRMMEIIEKGKDREAIQAAGWLRAFVADFLNPPGPTNYGKDKEAPAAELPPAPWKPGFKTTQTIVIEPVTPETIDGGVARLRDTPESADILPLAD